jgi:fucose 4-O-acetylase-like acetyltransferase
MPAFFMISGYFMHLNHVTNPFQDKAYLWKQCKRYVYPYFAWSILLYLLCFPENPLKYLVRILYGGHMNITVFSFPYWFINTLFISLIFIRYLHWLAAKQTSCVGRHIELITCVIFWALAHIILPLPINLPWGLNQALMAVCFIYIGYLFQKIPFKAWYILVAAVIVGIFIANRATWNFKFNMSETAFNSYWLDFLVPISFTILMYAVSLLLSKVKYVSKVLAFLGESSITIYFTHAFTMYTVHPWIPDMRVRILLAIVLGALIHYGFDKNVWLRKYFLGKS